MVDNPREAVNKQVPGDWEPKSDFFKALMGKGRVVKQVSLTCPECACSLLITVEVTPAHPSHRSPGRP